MFRGLFLLKLQQEQDLELVQAEKDLDKTIACVQGLLDHVDSLSGFTGAPLYSHMPFQKIDPRFPEYIRQSMLDEFRSSADFSYRKDDPRWKQLMDKSK